MIRALLSTFVFTTLLVAQPERTPVAQPAFFGVAKIKALVGADGQVTPTEVIGGHLCLLKPRWRN
jgi:hypothetical protein